MSWSRDPPRQAQPTPHGLAEAAMILNRMVNQSGGHKEIADTEGRAEANEPPVLWHLKVSHYNEKARWALDYKGIPHRRRAAIPGRHARIAQRTARSAAAAHRCSFGLDKGTDRHECLNP